MQIPSLSYKVEILLVQVAAGRQNGGQPGSLSGLELFNSLMDFYKPICINLLMASLLTLCAIQRNSVNVDREQSAIAYEAT